jgi:2-polyprenyl-3-methyl-5-hydroxy-6-metoxy-1,4-benzoquinol methylase
MSELIDLALQDGNYQDVYVRGERVVSGWRDCEERWEVIAQHLKPKQSVLDIGSHFGFFEYQIAKNFPGSFVWSIEAGERRARVQRLMLEENQIDSVVLTEHAIDLNDLVSLTRSCEHFDTIICLSTIHYFPP